MSDPMQPHPEELLAGFVDDPAALSPQDRQAVDSHLASCARCRDDVALAARGLGAMALLEEVPVPLGVTGPVLSKVRTERPWLARAARPIAATAAAAAIFIGGFAILSSLGGSSDDAGSESAGDAGGDGDMQPTAAVQMEVYDQDFSDADLDVLAAQAAGEEAALSRTDASSAAEDAEGPAETGSPESGAPPAPSPPDGVANAGPALECLAKGAELEAGDRPVKVISARFNGTPAYIGFYVRSPGAGQDPDRMMVWVVDADTCGVVSFATRGV